MSAFTNFRTCSALPDWPLVEETGVPDDEGFQTDEQIAFGMKNVETLMHNDEE